MSVAVPTLSTEGWVKDVTGKADRLMSYFLVSDFSQTAFYPGTISSLPYLVQQYGSNAFEIEQRTRDTLYELFQRYFDGVEVQVSTETPSPEEPNKINLTISATVVSEGKAYSLGRLINVNNNLIQQIINLNDQGSST